VRRTAIVALILVACTNTIEGDQTPESSEGESESGEGEGEGEPSEGEGEPSEGEGESGEGEGESGEGEGEPSEGEGEGDVATTLRLLMIGNSQLGVNRPNPPNVPAALTELSTRHLDAATTIEADAVQQNGTGCGGFWQATDATSARARVESGDYDVVILLPAIFETSSDESCWQDFQDLAEDAGSVFAIMATGHIASAFPSGFETLHNAVAAYADAHPNAVFIPAGDAWLRVLGTSPGNSLYEFYSGDDAHPGVEASYIYVLATYGALTGRSVIGAPRDLQGLRCPPTGACLSTAELEACIEPDGQNGCSQPQPGELFDGNGRQSIIDEAEAQVYQQAVQDALAAR
jgi:hypothetical protein